MEKEITTINVNTASREDIQKFMIDNEIYTCAEFGRFVGLSRERIRQVFKERENLDFKEMKRNAVKATYVVKPIEKKRWKQITFVDTKYPYYVTRKGEVGRDVIRKPKGVEIIERKLLTPSKNDKGHLRVNLTLEDGRHKTFYLQIHHKH